MPLPYSAARIDPTRTIPSHQIGHATSGQPARRLSNFLDALILGGTEGLYLNSIDFLTIDSSSSHDLSTMTNSIKTGSGWAGEFQHTFNNLPGKDITFIFNNNSGHTQELVNGTNSPLDLSADPYRLPNGVSLLLTRNASTGKMVELGSFPSGRGDLGKLNRYDHTTITDTSGTDVAFNPTDGDNAFFEVSEDLAADLSIQPSSTDQLNGIRATVLRTGNNGAFTFKITGLAYPVAGELELGTDEMTDLVYVSSVGWFALGKQSLTSTASISYDHAEVVVTGNLNISNSTHRHLSASGTTITRRILKVRRPTDTAITITFPDNPTSDTWTDYLIEIDDDHTSPVTLSRDSSGDINGATSVDIAPGKGAKAWVSLRSQETGPDVAHYSAEGDLAEASTWYGAVDANGNVLSGHFFSKVTRGAGSSQPTDADCGKRITTDGALTIPTSEGWWAPVILGGDHDITFNSQTLDVSAEGWGTGDILSVEVTSSTTIEVVRTAASNVVDESSFV